MHLHTAAHADETFHKLNFEVLTFVAPDYHFLSLFTSNGAVEEAVHSWLAVLPKIFYEGVTYNNGQVFCKTERLVML